MAWIHCKGAFQAKGKGKVVETCNIDYIMITLINI